MEIEVPDEDMQIYWDTRAQQFIRISGNGDQESAVRSTPDWATGFMEAEFESGGVKQTTMSYIEWQSAMPGKGAPSGVSKKRPASVMVCKKPAAAGAKPAAAGAKPNMDRKCLYSREYHGAVKKFLSDKKVTAKNQKAAKEHGRKVAGKAVRQLLG